MPIAGQAPLGAGHEPTLEQAPKQSKLLVKNSHKCVKSV